MKSLLVMLALGAGTAVAQTQTVATAAPAAVPAAKETNVVVTIETSEGTIAAELYPDKAPATVKNFLAYADAKFYDGTIFHRVIKGFMIQGGGFTADMRQKETRSPIANEADNGLKNDRGTLAMARTSDPNSATSQFFINHVNNAGLNRPSPDGYGYAVFGKVTAGMDVVDKIAATPTGSGSVPLHTVSIKSIRRQAAASAPAPAPEPAK